MSYEDFTSTTFTLLFDYKGKQRQCKAKPQGDWMVFMHSEDELEFMVCIDLEEDDSVTAYIEEIIPAEDYITDEGVGEELISDYIFLPVGRTSDGTIEILIEA